MIRTLARALVVMAAAALGASALGQVPAAAPAAGPAVNGGAETPALPPGAASSPGGVSGGSAITGLDPVSIIAGASGLLPSAAGASVGASAAGGSESGGPRLSSLMSIMALLTVIALAPSIILMTTCFVRIQIVLAMLRQAMGTQNLPQPQVIMALSLFMTLLVMTPTLSRVQAEAIGPYQRGEVAGTTELWDRAKQPMRDFMFAQIEATGNWSSVYMVLNYRGIDTSRPEALTRADVDMVSLVPAFMLSELKTAFLLGFRVYLPFLVIDIVISSLLISMSMMMLPPVLISLPFKLLLFVLVDGWQLVVGSLMLSFKQPGAVALLVGPVGGVFA